MIAFPELLVKPAQKAEIKVPKDIKNYDTNDYPHWHVYNVVQLGKPLPNFSAHWYNAKIIAQIPKEKIMSITIDELIELGLQVKVKK